MVALNEKRPGTLMQAIRYFDAEQSEALVRSIKWPTDPCCPQCGSINVGEIKSRRRFQCREKGCRKQFSLITGTIMESTHLRLEQWMVGIWMIANCRNGVSSCEIARTIGCKQQSAWHLLHRVRHILKIENDRQFSGGCETDTTFVGGLFKHMTESRRAKARLRGNKGKVVVHAIKERSSGEIRAEVIEAETTELVRDAVLENVQDGSTIFTDEGRVFQWISQAAYKHETVNHSIQYVKGEAHTNGCENFFNCLRRSVKGTYIKPTAEHLSAYVDEAVFRFNVRKDTDWERFEKAVRMIVGKRLAYRDLTDGAVR